MNFKVDINKLLKILIVVVILVFALLVFIVGGKLKSSIDINSKLEANIDSTGWPKEVPIIKSELVKIDKYVNEKDSTKISWAIEIKKGISYSQFREYAIELYKAGFEPVKNLGSKNPNFLVMNPVLDEEFYVLWYGVKDDLLVEVFWEEFSEENEAEEGELYYSFTISLYKDPKYKSINTNGDKTEKIESGDLNATSGDISSSNNVSGDIISGDNISDGNISGDNISGDNTSGDGVNGNDVIESNMSGEIL